LVGARQQTGEFPGSSGSLGLERMNETAPTVAGGCILDAGQDTKWISRVSPLDRLRKPMSIERGDLGRPAGRPNTPEAN